MIKQLNRWPMCSPADRRLLGVSFAVIVITMFAVARRAGGKDALAPPARGRVIQVVRDFENGSFGDRRPAALYWNWTPEQKAHALDYSSMEIVDGAAWGEKCLKLVVTDQLPRRSGYRMVPLGVDYLPPEADAVRLRVKVLKGHFAIAVGGPTVYFGHSDVLTRAVQLDATTHAQWTTLELSLNHDLTRNDRRAGWGRNSPVCCYTRWIQEPMAIEVAAGSAGEMLIDQIELIALGQGRPYPAFEPGQIRTIVPVLDFEAEVEMEKVFTVMTSAAEQPQFDQPPHLVRKTWLPPRLARVPEGTTRRHSLEMIMRGTEEVCFAGLKLPDATDANAIALTLKAEHPGKGRAGVVLDFVTWAAPAESRGGFPWDELRPPEAWRKQPEIAFTYYLHPKNARAARSSLAFYHTRRLVPRDQWVTLVLPLADFACSYGQGKLAGAFQKQTLLSGDQLLALTFLSYFGQTTYPTRVLIDEVKLVRVPGEPEKLRSFYQPPAP